MSDESDYESAAYDDVPDDAPEADVLEQRQSSTVVDDLSDESGVPAEADPADVEEQRHDVGDEDEDDYR